MNGRLTASESSLSLLERSDGLLTEFSSSCEEMVEMDPSASDDDLAPLLLRTLTDDEKSSRTTASFFEI